MDTSSDVLRFDAAQMASVECNFDNNAKNFDCTFTKRHMAQMQHLNDTEELTSSDSESSDTGEEYLQAYVRKNIKNMTEDECIKMRIERFFQNPIERYGPIVPPVNLSSDMTYSIYKDYRQRHTLGDCFPTFNRHVEKYVELFLTPTFKSSWEHLAKIIKVRNVEVKYKNETHNNIHYKTIISNGQLFYNQIVYYNETVKFCDSKHFEKLRLRVIDTFQLEPHVEKHENLIKLQIMDLHVQFVPLEIVHHTNTDKYKIKIGYTNNATINMWWLLNQLEQLFCNDYLTSIVVPQSRPVTIKEFARSK